MIQQAQLIWLGVERKYGSDTAEIRKTEKKDQNSSQSEEAVMSETSLVFLGIAKVRDCRWLGGAHCFVTVNTELI